jgi:hypothetical protein
VFQLMGDQARTGVRRGVNAVVEGIRTGETPNEIAGHAVEDIVSTALHPYTGPIIGAVERGLPGNALIFVREKVNPMDHGIFLAAGGRGAGAGGLERSQSASVDHAACHQ